MYSIIPGGWGTAQLHFARSTNWGTYDTIPTMTLSGNNVGIGTTGPEAKLNVVDTTPADIYDPMLRIGDSVTSGAANTGGQLSFSGHDGSVARDWAFLRGMKENATVANYASYLSLGTRANGGALTEQVRITSSGNVGIGTTNPSAKLEVVGNINAAGNVKLSSTGYIHSGGNVIIRLGTA